MREQIEAARNHTIFCGFSRLSRIAAAELGRTGEQIVIIESDQVRGREAEQAGFLVVYGDATLDESLTSAGVARAKRLVSAYRLCGWANTELERTFQELPSVRFRDRYNIAVLNLRKSRGAVGELATSFPCANLSDAAASGALDVGFKVIP